ncbi:MAG: radical SAM protein, partial [Lachnospiraceae bacterium]|nr:radical SAM protein [Lachnospiraceae bacterium]
MQTDLEKLYQFKKKELKLLSDYRKQLYSRPLLRHFFLELTLRCNERCLHCGSSCGDVPSEELSLAQYQDILDQVAEDFDVSTFMLCITGGEPLLRKDFFDILGYANDKGYIWGMTSNGTLITPEVAHKLRLAGMKTISVSIDGLQSSHDAFRQTPGGYKKAMEGIQNLINEGGFSHIQVTSVMNHSNMHELDDLYEIFCDMDIDSWRVIGIEPMGRALSHPELLLTPEDQERLFDFIREKRMENMPVTYGCSHY